MTQADGEKTCVTCRNEDTYHCAECENKSDYEQAQADGEYISIKYIHSVLHNHMFDNAHRPTIYAELKRISKELDGLTVAIPSAEPKTGHWEWVQYDSNPNIGNWHCSECRTIIPHMPEETDNTPIYKWCPMCGAKMVEPQERSE